MQILMTGFSIRMSGQSATKAENDYLSTSFLLKEILTEQLRHQIDHRKVTPGDDLGKYDLALLGICPTGSIADRAEYISGTAWAFTNARCPKLLFCEDWRIEEVETQFRSTLRHWERYAAFKEYEPEDGNRIQAMLLGILNQRLPLLASFFPWGNHYLLFRNNLTKAAVLEWDPSPFLRLPEPVKVAPAERARRWVYATLQNKHGNWLEKQQLTWGVDRYGKGNRISEEKLVQEEYPQRWGILAPRYKSASSGWWRVRFNHAASLGAVMLCDRADAQVMGRPYQISASTVERMSVDELAALAQEQRDWFQAHIATRDKTLVDLEHALNVAEDSGESAAA